MIRINITSDIRSEAERRDKEAYNRFGTTATKLTNSRRHGFIAEVACKHTLAGMEYTDENEIDLRNWMGESFDVKCHTTKQEPTLYDVCTIPETSKIHADHLIYCFANDNSVWIAGHIPTRIFCAICELMPVGHQGKYFTYDYARYQILVGDLDPITSLMPIKR